jgi:hypothetical protein
VAILADRLQKGSSKASKDKIILPPDFFDDFCQRDGWDMEEYKKVRLTKGTKE